MKRPSNPSSGNPSRSSAGERGAALVVVLGFVVMLLALLMAYFSRGVLQRQISDASSGLAVENLLAQSAVEVLISDIRQEIAQGSVGGGIPVFTNPTTGQVTRVFIPVTNTAASPFVSPPSLTNNTGTNVTNGMENVVKISSSAYPNVFPASTNAYTNASAAPRRVAAGDYTTNPTANGRSVSAARWNKSLLLSRQNPFSDTDLTPVSTFIPPEWIPVTRSDSNPISWSSDLVYSPTNPTSIIGRYAYIIYNEGGLLDANAAGYPPALGSSATAPNTSIYTPNYKTVEGFADLTQLGLNTNQILALVGWRNAASAPSAGSYPKYNFGSLTNYAASLLTNSNGFLRAFGSGSLTDRRFTRRQQLIDFLSNADPQNRPAALTALQSLGTFSRSVVQPSFQPDPTRPRVVAGQAPDYASAGGNDAAGGDDIINPSFLTNRVTNSFTRNDGSSAQIGEPLVKQRFALNRLSWITYKGPSADLYSANRSDPVIQSYLSNGISVDMLTNGTSNNIQKYFGLSWDGTSGTWTYSQRLGSGGSIYTLPKITGREPDFFELLKAATHVGSVAKASTAGALADTNNLWGPPSLMAPLNWQYARDTSVDSAIIQEGANIIDQFDPDSFPTRIRFKGSATNNIVTEFRGVEDLPYIYRIRYGNLNVVSSGSVSTNTFNGGVTYEHSASNGVTFPTSLTNSGIGLLMAVPEVWNPHDVNGLGKRTITTSLIPANLRIVSASTYPENIINSTNTYNQIAIAVRPDSSQPTNGAYYPSNNPSAALVFMNSSSQTNSFYALTNSVTPPGPPFPGGYTNAFAITTNTSSLIFSNATNLYREPTLLAEKGVPAGSFLQMTCSNPQVLSLSNSTFFQGDSMRVNYDSLAKGRATPPYSFVGLYLGMFPLQYVSGRSSGMPNAAPTSVTSQVYTAGLVIIAGTPYASISYQLQYQDSLGRWVTYDEKYGDVPVWVRTSGNLIQGKNDPTAISFTDPRTGRFGAPNVSGNGIYNAAFNYSSTAPLANQSVCWIDPTNNVICTERPDYSSGFGSDIRDTRGWINFAAPGWHVMNIGPSSGDAFYQPSLLSQNNPYFTDDMKRWAGDRSSTPTDPQFYSDPDGVIRRAAGAYLGYGSNVTTGLPLATATNYSGLQSASRPFLLNRPFRSVAELGYVFSGKPWKNINFFTPESGDAPLLDIFCLNPPPPDQITAGTVDLNTRQGPVLAAIVAKAYRDPVYPVAVPLGIPSAVTAADASNAASTLIACTVTNKLAYISDLVGRWTLSKSVNASFTPALDIRHSIDGAASYTGFSSLLTSTNASNNLIQRYREAPIRALSAVGQTRVWNLMVDLIVQSGKIPPSASGFDGFLVKGEVRYWVHLAIDRYTGQVLDKQIEVVHE